MEKNIKFTSKENEILTEVYRRLNYFQKGDIHASLMLLQTPHKVKTLKDKKILKCTSMEQKGALNWYELTDSGKELFKNYICTISGVENQLIFDGNLTLDFNKDIQEFKTLQKGLQQIYNIAESLNLDDILSEVLKITDKKNIEILM